MQRQEVVCPQLGNCRRPQFRSLGLTSVSIYRSAPPDMQWPLRLDRTVCPVLTEARTTVSLSKSEMRPQMTVGAFLSWVPRELGLGVALDSEQ